MRIAHIFIFCSCIRIKGEVLREKAWLKPQSTFPVDCTNVVLLFSLGCVSVVTCGVCNVLVCSSVLLLTVPRECCNSS